MKPFLCINGEICTKAVAHHLLLSDEKVLWVAFLLQTKTHRPIHIHKVHSSGDKGKPRLLCRRLCVAGSQRGQDVCGERGDRMPGQLIQSLAIQLNPNKCCAIACCHDDGGLSEKEGRRAGCALGSLRGFKERRPYCICCTKLKMKGKKQTENDITDKLCNNPLWNNGKIL